MSFIIRVIVNALALWAAVLLIDGIEITTQDTTGQILAYLAVGLIFGVVNAIIKPIVKTVGCLFYALTLGLIGLVVNALLFLLTEWIAGLFGLPFEIAGFWDAFWGAIIVAVVSWLISLFLPDGKDD
ncbi:MULTISPECIES: phage holin family protein [Nocardiopsis]|uniref:Phage holin family protein n=1 Tax=Nocardiopsis lambiniae TaxID=3075539 RepID=A0ABU2M4F0_9ACTN|nr:MULTISPECIES: phage holin family protein [unclassified Nocardiopsis]MDE3720016.1 phage holin family protein [Nocardiopsis sp. N85]MDT0327477.1 phage holin family protein [Nocardiopsis sp. DSM 44743]